MNRRDFDGKLHPVRPEGWVSGPEELYVSRRGTDVVHRLYRPAGQRLCLRSGRSCSGRCWTPRIWRTGSASGPT